MNLLNTNLTAKQVQQVIGNPKLTTRTIKKARQKRKPALKRYNELASGVKPNHDLIEKAMNLNRGYEKVAQVRLLLSQAIANGESIETIKAKAVKLGIRIPKGI